MIPFKRADANVRSQSYYVDRPHLILYAHHRTKCVAFGLHGPPEELPFPFFCPPDSQIFNGRRMKDNAREVFLLHLQHEQEREIVPFIFIDHVVVDKHASRIKNRLSFIECDPLGGYGWNGPSKDLPPCRSGREPASALQMKDCPNWGRHGH